MQAKNLLKRNTISVVEGRNEIVKTVVTPFDRLTSIWCGHEAGCLSELTELGFTSAPQLVNSDWSSFTMEKIEGTSLGSLPFLEEPLFRRILEAVRQLHTLGFAHGNLRSNNILIRVGGEPVLIDFETCVRRGNPLFLFVKYHDHVKLYLLWHSQVRESDRAQMGRVFPMYVTLAMVVIAPLIRLAFFLRLVKKRLRHARAAFPVKGESRREGRKVGTGS